MRRYDVRFTAESGHYAAICSIDVVSSFGVRILSEDVDRNLAAKSKSSQLFLGAVERKRLSVPQDFDCITYFLKRRACSVIVSVVIKGSRVSAPVRSPMSAFPPKAYIVQHDRDVRFVPKRDIIQIRATTLYFPPCQLHREIRRGRHTQSRSLL